MNNFLTKCIFAEQSRILCLLKKSTPEASLVAASLVRTSTHTSNTFTSTSSVRNFNTTSANEDSCKYNVKFKTGTMMGAGTDSNIFLRLIGELGSTDEIQVDCKKNDTEKGSTDQYEIPLDDVGHLRKIVVRMDATGLAPGWFLEWVNITDEQGKEYRFKCNQWLMREDGHTNIKLLKEDNFVEVEEVEKQD